MNVFRDCLGLESPNLDERSATEQPPATGEKGTVVAVAPGLKCPKKERLFVLDPFTDAQVALKNIRIVEVVRRLDDCHLRVVKKPDGIFEKCSGWDVIDVEDGYELSVSQPQRMVQIARFRMSGSVRAPDILTAERVRQLLGFATMTVVEHMHGKSIARILL
jgi:hypothetical protein